MKRVLMVAAGLVLLLVLAGGALLWWRNFVPQPVTFTLSNGAVVTFKGATFGTNHVAPTGPVFARFVPKMFARWLGWPAASGASHTTASPSVVMWFGCNGPGNGPQSWTCSLIHEDGFESEFERNRFFASYSPTNTIEGITSLSPQRDKFLRVRFYEVKNWSELTSLGDFTLRNPQVARISRPAVPELPQTASNGELEITLNSLSADTRRGRRNSIKDDQTVAKFTVREGGLPSTNWTVQKMEATDSTGGRLVSQSWSGQSRKGEEVFECQPVLWPEESYTIRFEFSRKAEAPFATNELWTIRGIANPTNGGFTLVDTQVNLGGVPLRFHGVTTQGATPPWHPMTSGEAALSFSTTNMLKDHRFSLLRIADERGRAVTSTGSSYSDTEWGFGFRPITNAQTIDVTVALHRSRYVEFFARPTLTTNQMRW